MHNSMWKALWMWLWVVAPLASAPDATFVSNEPKIYGGRFAQNGEFPYAVFIVYKDAPRPKAFAGTIATLSRIITVGHCFMEKLVRRDATKYEIVGGTVDHSGTSEEKQVRKVINFTVHEGFASKTDGTLYHDIAVAELDKPFTASSTLSIMKVSSLDEEENKIAWDKFERYGKSCTAVGWGSTVEDKPEHSNTLKAVELKLWTDAACKDTVLSGDKDMTEKGEICLGQVKPGESICLGDSGGPLICDKFVVGLARIATDCKSDEAQHFLLFWPYLKYFGLASETSKSTIAYGSRWALLSLTAAAILTSIL